MTNSLSIWSATAQTVVAVLMLAVAYFTYKIGRDAEAARRRADKERIDSAFKRVSVELEIVDSLIESYETSTRFFPILSRSVWEVDMPLVLPELSIARGQYLTVLYKDLVILDDLRSAWKQTFDQDATKAKHPGHAFEERLAGFRAGRPDRLPFQEELRVRAFGEAWRGVFIVQKIDKVSPPAN